MTKLIDLSGQMFGRLSVINRVDGLIPAKWHCLCECGTSCIVSGGALRSGHTKSCGCLHKERAADKRTALNLKHGMSKKDSNGSRNKEYLSWLLMKNRCYNPRNNSYADYGLRGISVCDRWRDSFEAFLFDMGEAPTKRHTLDRIDNNKDYSADNCRWASPTEQARNRRSSRYITHNGVTKLLVEWAEFAGITQQQLAGRLHKGWSFEDALSRAVRRRHSILPHGDGG